MSIRRARRLGALLQSDIRRMTRECERVGGINLGQGICDLPTPPLVRDGAIEAIRARKSTYSYAEGTLELREVIARKLAERNGIRADPRSEIVVTVGATGAFARLERTRVASVPGSAFFRGPEGERCVRFCFAKEHDALDEACRRLEALGA